MKKKNPVVDFILVVIAALILVAVSYGLFCLPYLTVSLCFGFDFTFREALGWYIIWVIAVLPIVRGGNNK